MRKYSILFRLEQESIQVQSVLSRAKAENNRAKDQLTTVKTRVKAREETLARGQDEEKVIGTRINAIKAEAGREKDNRFNDVALYQSEVMELCGQLRETSISGGNLVAVEKRKEVLVRELKEIEQELACFDQEGRQDALNLEDWAGLLKKVEIVRKSFEATKGEMERKASMMAKERSDKEIVVSQGI